MRSLYYWPFPFGVAFNEHHEKWGEKDDDGRQIAIAVGGQNSRAPTGKLLSYRKLKISNNSINIVH